MTCDILRIDQYTGDANINQSLDNLYPDIARKSPAIAGLLGQ